MATGINAAGETYDPASIGKIGETTVVFMDGDKELGFIAIGVNYIEGPGCGMHLISHLMAKDRSTLRRHDLAAEIYHLK